MLPTAITSSGVEAVDTTLAATCAVCVRCTIVRPRKTAVVSANVMVIPLVATAGRLITIIGRNREYKGMQRLDYLIKD